eukprot:2089408-Rhodomonas_salina.1
MAAIVMTVNKNRSGAKKPEASAKWTVEEPKEALIDDPTRQHEEPVARFQRWIREKYFYKNKRLHRLNLAERLNFEHTTVFGLLRFFNQLMVFGLFVAALSFSSDQEVMRGILSTLTNEFDFEGMSE